MESALVVVALLVLAGGVATLLTRQRMLPWSLPSFRSLNGADVEAVGNGVEPGSATGRPPEAIKASASAAPVAVVRPSSVPRQQPAPSTGRLEPGEPIRLGVVPASGEGVAARFDRIEERLEELNRLMAKQNEARSAELRRVQSELTLRAEAEASRHDAGQERLRADLLAAMSGTVAQRGRAASERRSEVTSELYARLARLEAALATVTNPVLLPGEIYAPPKEFIPEALNWENWNEVGERAFALADSFNAQRLHLSEQTRIDVGGFVTNLRTLLTRSVYPNLQPEPDLSQQAALRLALEEIAVALPKVRDQLEKEYRNGESE
ncbi:MAG: hypothetical protein ACRDJC_05720 [Thermomicrobiales bacterium]